MEPGSAAMKTIRKLLYREIIGSVVFVAVAFLALFYFIDFVDELNDKSRRDLSAWRAAGLAALEIPGHLYELMPIAVLIGTIYALSRMAQSSEFTILRTGGLGPVRALTLLATLGLVFATLTWLIGDYVAPAAERQVAVVKARDSGRGVGAAGVWLKERRVDETSRERIVAVNIRTALATGELLGVRIYEHDDLGQLLTRIEATSAHVDRQGQWLLKQASVTDWPLADDPTGNVVMKRHSELVWRSSLGADVVSAAVLPLKTMTTTDLWRYSRHLLAQAQDSQRYAIQFWKKALYPLACLVMVALALPFAYLHARSGGISVKVFGGIMLGISFVLLNNVAGHLGVLREWTPWVAAATPALMYLLLALLAFTWLVRYR
jgi:lipopolysaccharide export system permease protein